jgi:hypothetical protein
MTEESREEYLRNIAIRSADQIIMSLHRRNAFLDDDVTKLTPQSQDVVLAVGVLLAICAEFVGFSYEEAMTEVEHRTTARGMASIVINEAKERAKQ